MKQLVVILIILFFQSAQANLMINEVLSNEPEGFTSLEWIELYNNSNTTQQLSEFTLVVDSNTIILPALLIEPDSYIIICKKLFSINNETSFESYWSNGSKVWGDTEYELTIVEPIVLSFSLLNDSGTIQLLQQGIVVSSFKWDEKSDDGTSWERKSTDSALIAQSKSFSKSTPGILNSITLVQKDLAIESVDVLVEDFIPVYTFTISNRGLTEINDGVLNIYDSTQSILVQSVSVPLIVSDSAIQLEISFQFSSIELYEPLVAIVETSQDFRSANDTLHFIAVSNQYPPIIISEFLANPQLGKTTEWIEIYNRSSQSVDLQDWYIGDALKLNQIISEPFILEPNNYVVLVKSEIDFLTEYPLFDELIIEPESWAILNNESDRIRLQDNFLITADTYYYTSLFDKNYPIAREIQNKTYQWGRASEQNGTPGYDNTLFETEADNQVEIKLSSKYISPDGDGFEDRVVISLKVPLSESYTLKIYNLDGNLVKTIFSNKKLISNQITWDGFGDNNSQLPIGIYILYLSTKDGLHAKETIVIAR